MRRNQLTALTLCCILVIQFLPPTTSYSVSGPFFIQSLANCQFLDIENQNMCMGAKVITCPLCNRTSQMWDIYDLGSGFMIVNRFNGLVLDIENGGMAPGASIITWSATYACNQRWSFEGDGVIRSGRNNLVLDVCGGGHEGDTGSKVVGYIRHGGINQQYRTVAVGSYIPRQI
ncbi:hypothetical protein CHUAL_004198 [Chamberlinius hualienensis]